MRLVVIAVPAVAALLLASCGNSGGNSGGTASSSSNCGLKLGVLEPLSGAAAGLGQPVFEGIQLAVDEANRQGGADGCQVTIDSQDYKSDPSVAVTRVQRLITDKVYGIIGPNQGSATLAIAPIIKGAKIPICAFNNTISITHSDNPYIFRCQTDDTDNVRAAILFAKQQFKATKVAILTTDDAYGKDAAAALSDVSKSGSTSIQITDTITFPYTATDITSEWSRAKSGNPDVYILWGSGSSMAVALRNASQLGVTQPIIGGQGLASASIIDAAGAAAEGVYAIGLIDPSKTTPTQQVVSDLLKKKNGADFQPTLYNYIGWDAANLMMKAFEKDHTDAKAGLESLNEVVLTSGTYHFSAANRNGLGLDSIWVTQIKNGKFIGVHTGLS